MELKLLICVAKQISCSKDISSVVMADWIAGSTTSQTTPCHFLYSPQKPASQPSWEHFVSGCTGERLAVWVV